MEALPIDVLRKGVLSLLNQLLLLLSTSRHADRLSVDTSSFFITMSRSLYNLFLLLALCEENTLRTLPVSADTVELLFDRTISESVDTGMISLLRSLKRRQALSDIDAAVPQRMDALVSFTYRMALIDPVKLHAYLQPHHRQFAAILTDLWSEFERHCVPTIAPRLSIAHPTWPTTCSSPKLRAVHFIRRPPRSIDSAFARRVVTSLVRGIFVHMTAEAAGVELRSSKSAEGSTDKAIGEEHESATAMKLLMRLLTHGNLVVSIGFIGCEQCDVKMRIVIPSL